MATATSARAHAGADAAAASRPRALQLRWHLGAYALLLLALALFGHLGGSWTSDDGAYATQVATVRETGQWAQPASPIDPDLRAFAYPNATRSGDRGFVYVHHPAWIALLVGTTRLFGHVLGLYVVNLAAAAATAACAWTLAGRLERRLAPAAFWLTALGPVLVHAPTIWAHATAAALGGVAALALARLVGDRARPVDAVVLGAASGAMVLLRTEGALFAAAVLVTLGCAHLARSGLYRLGDLAVKAGPTVVLAGFATVVDGRWAAHLAPAASQLNVLGDEAERSWLSGRLPGLVASFLEPGSVLTILGCVLLLAAAVLVRRGYPAVPLPTAVALCGTGVLALRLVQDPWPLIGGLLPAAPVAALGWLGWRRRDAASGERALAALVAVFMGLVVVTQYAAGGAFEWGGRFLAPVIVPFTVLGVRGIAGLVDRIEPARARTGAITLLGAVTVLVAATGLRTTTQARRSAEARVATIAATRPEVVVSTDPALPRFAWRTVPDVQWFATDLDGVGDLLARSAAIGVDRLAVAGRGSDGVEATGWHRRVVDPRLVVLTRR